MEASICRLYYFTGSQMQSFSGLIDSMKSCRAALAALAVANILLSLVTAMAEQDDAPGGAAVLLAISTVTALEAAAKYPPLVVGASGAFFGYACTAPLLLSLLLNCYKV
ncbi:hypothetical protein HaLaN_16033, partial [Haematococcus lacustris]